MTTRRADMSTARNRAPAPVSRARRPRRVALAFLAAAALLVALGCLVLVLVPDLLAPRWTVEPDTTGAGTGAEIARVATSTPAPQARAEADRRLAAVGIALPESVQDLTVDSVTYEPQPGHPYEDVAIVRFRLASTELDAIVAAAPFSTTLPPHPSARGGCVTADQTDMLGAPLTEACVQVSAQVVVDLPPGTDGSDLAWVHLIATSGPEPTATVLLYRPPVR